MILYIINVEAMTSKIILMMTKNQELSKFQRFKNQVSRIMIQEQSRSRLKTQDSRIKRRLNQDNY